MSVFWEAVSLGQFTVYERLQRAASDVEKIYKAEETKRTFNIVLGSIAGISLLVGGIGIMNIMLASVTDDIAFRRDVDGRHHLQRGVSMGISFCVGIIFGLYPAVRAANLDPILALRHE